MVLTLMFKRVFIWSVITNLNWTIKIKKYDTNQNWLGDIGKSVFGFYIIEIETNINYEKETEIPNGRKYPGQIANNLNIDKCTIFFVVVPFARIPLSFTALYTCYSLCFFTHSLLLASKNSHAFVNGYSLHIKNKAGIDVVVYMMIRRTPRTINNFAVYIYNTQHTYIYVCMCVRTLFGFIVVKNFVHIKWSLFSYSTDYTIVILCVDRLLRQWNTLILTLYYSNLFFRIDCVLLWIKLYH